MFAVSRDGNDQMFPIACAIVEGENNSNWEWFFTHLKPCLELGQGQDMGSVSDEHQPPGIITPPPYFI